MMRNKELGMPHWLNSDFARNSDTYTKAQKHWEKLWRKVIATVNADHPWQSPWVNNPNSDGNPIFSAVCPTLRHGIRIIQEERPGTNENDLDWWIDCFGPKSASDAVRELVISCCPSRENQTEIEALLREWVETGNIVVPPEKKRAAI
jgi:hypothetical protein